MPGLRGLASVVAGFVLLNLLMMFLVMGLVSFFPDAAAAAEAGRTPPMTYILANLALSTFVAFVASFATARLAPEPKLTWVYALAAVVVVGGLIYGISGLLRPDGVQPAWYLVSLPILGGLAVAFGGRWYLGRAARRG